MKRQVRFPFPQIPIWNIPSRTKTRESFVLGQSQVTNNLILGVEDLITVGHAPIPLLEDAPALAHSFAGGW